MILFRKEKSMNQMIFKNYKNLKKLNQIKINLKEILNKNL